VRRCWQWGYKRIVTVVDVVGEKTHNFRCESKAFRRRGCLSAQDDSEGVKAAPEKDEVHAQPAALAACLGRPGGRHGPLPAEPLPVPGRSTRASGIDDDPRTVVAAPSPVDSRPSRSFSPLTAWAHSHAAGAATSCSARFRHWLGRDRRAILATAWPPRRSAGRARAQPQPNDTRPDRGRYWPVGLPRPPPASPAPGLTEPTAERLAERADAADTRWLDTGRLDTRTVGPGTAGHESGRQTVGTGRRRTA
jgi:hypothetical protein